MKRTGQKGIIFIPLFFVIPLVVVGLYFGAGTGFWENMTSGIKKFLAAPSPSNLPQQLGQWQREPTGTLTPTPTIKLVGEVQTKPYTYKQAATASKTGALPSFTINAPSGWVKTGSSGNELVRFESPEIDTEEVEGGTITTNATVNIRATDSYSDLDDFVSQYKASGSKSKDYRLLSSSPRKDGSQSLEFTYQTKIGDGTITIHELAYLFFKDDISFLVKGHSADSAWDKHAGEIRSALDSFKF